jgi:hypothetical protein
MRKRHWTLHKILVSPRAKGTLVYIAERKRIKLSEWHLHSGFAYYYLQFFISDCLRLGLIRRIEGRGMYEATEELTNFLNEFKIKNNGGFNAIASEIRV